MAFLYSSCFASYVIDDSFKVVERLAFSDIIRANSLLEVGKWLPEEDALIAKHHPATFIGAKSEKKEGIKPLSDGEKLGRILQAVSMDMDEFFRANVTITKADLKASVGDDLLIIHAIDSIDALNKAINTIVKRLREWYELYNPEFSRSAPDHQKFVEAIITTEKDKLLGQIGLTADITMGADLKKEDVAPIMDMAGRANELYQLKKREEEYLEGKMKEVSPNVTSVAGYLIGAKLIAFAGSTKRLAELPSSTIQLLGAEKALFRHITRKSLPPKYGVLHEHPLISRARKEDHGKVARLIADKLSIAAKVDYFKGEYVGEKLREDMEKRLRSL